MKRIKSKIDVITNSSTEVFTCRTSMGLSEVSKFLKETTSGYHEPEIMKKSKGCLKCIIDFGYLVNPSSKRSILDYYLAVIMETDYCDSDTFDIIEIPGAAEIKNAFGVYLWDRKEEVKAYGLKIFGKGNWRTDGFLEGDPEDGPYTREQFMKEFNNDFILGIKDSEMYPPGFIEDFLDSIPGGRPERFKIPEDLNADSYVGQIGFIGLEDNSIPYEDWDKIKEKLNARNWHLG